MNNLATSKLRYAGHIMRGSGGERRLLILEGMVEGQTNTRGVEGDPELGGWIT